jgi:hypothetical protein
MTLLRLIGLLRARLAETTLPGNIRVRNQPAVVDKVSDARSVRIWLIRHVLLRWAYLMRRNHDRNMDRLCA